MYIGILSRSIQLYSTRALFRAAQVRGHRVRVFDYLNCDILIKDDSPKIIYGADEIPEMDAVIPRIGSSNTFHGVAVVRQLQQMGIFSAVDADAIVKSRDKLNSLQYLCNQGLGIPNTLFLNNYTDTKHIIESIGGVPVIIKLLEGTHGIGVILAETFKTAEAIIEAFSKTKQKFILQEFIAESKGSDVRAFIVDDHVVASMKRSAQPGEFRSNLHRGGNSISLPLSSQEEETAIKACKLLGLKVAGVDMLQSDRGPLILEVNPSPGLEGISKTTGVDVAGKIIEYLERNTTKQKQMALDEIE